MKNQVDKAQRMKELLFREVDGMFYKAKEIVKEMAERGAAQEILTFVENSVKSRPEMEDVIRKRSKSGKAFADVLPDLRQIAKDC